MSRHQKLLKKWQGQQNYFFRQFSGFLVFSWLMPNHFCTQNRSPGPTLWCFLRKAITLWFHTICLTTFCNEMLQKLMEMKKHDSLKIIVFPKKNNDFQEIACFCFDGSLLKSIPKTWRIQCWINDVTVFWKITKKSSPGIHFGSQNDPDLASEISKFQKNCSKTRLQSEINFLINFGVCKNAKKNQPGPFNQGLPRQWRLLCHAKGDRPASKGKSTSEYFPLCLHSERRSVIWCVAPSRTRGQRRRLRDRACFFDVRCTETQFRTRDPILDTLRV